MCFDHDSRPPIQPIAGGALDSRDVTLTASDGNALTAFEAKATEPSGASIVILPDVRGLHAFYFELALRFAENGIDAVAIDWFGRTAGLGRREDGFDYTPHVNQLTWPGVSADIATGAAHARSLGPDRAANLFTIGFCMGGRMSFLAPTLGLELGGAIGLYGPPVGPGRAGSPAPADMADKIEAPILGIFGGADASIPPDAIATFDAALERAGVERKLVTYANAPHSFFDRKAAEFAEESRQAWDEVLAFIRGHTKAEPRNA
jgi:carboxymethylenebutenolidase